MELDFKRNSNIVIVTKNVLETNKPLPLCYSSILAFQVQYTYTWHRQKYCNSATLSCFARYSLPPHSPPQWAIADENASCWGSILEFLCVDLNILNIILLLRTWYEVILLVLAYKPLIIFFCFLFCFFSTSEHAVVEYLPPHHSTAQPMSSARSK